jgi:hypothetical protein
MCFSTEASFTAALILGATGGATLKNSTSRSQLFLAAIPLLFALQQLSEGLVWLHLSENIGSQTLFINAQRSFLMFAFIIWPTWIPLSFALLEQVPWRRRLLYFNLACGVGLSSLNLFYGLKQEPYVHVVHHSLQYLGKLPPQATIYPLVVLLPCFLSSLKGVLPFGIVITIGFFIAHYFYVETLTSVWCFFAAIVSLSIYKILKDNQALAEKTLHSKKPRF